MTILVTGANGLLGQKLTSLLASDPDIMLIASARTMPVICPAGVMNVRLDVTSTQEVDDAIATIRPDVVIHTAAMTQVDQCETDREQCWRSNVTAVEYLVTACQRNKVHLIHLSTDFIFDGSHGPLDENENPHPISYYGESKLASEEVVRKCTSPWTIIRTVLVYGITPNLSRSNIVIWVRKSLEEGKTIQVVDDQWRTPTLAEDLAAGCALAAKLQAKGIYHISGPEMMTPYQLALRTARFFGLNEALIAQTDSTKFTQPARRPPKTGFIIEKARRELGYKPHDFEEGLAIIRDQWPS